MRRIWRKPTRADLDALFDRWSSRINLADEFRKIARLLDAQNEFEEIIVPGQLPPPPLSRERDFAEAYKEIFGRTPEEDLDLQEALRLYEEKG